MKASAEQPPRANALQRTAAAATLAAPPPSPAQPSRSGCNPRNPQAGSLSLGRSAMRMFMLLLGIVFASCIHVARAGDEPPPKDWIKTECGQFVLYLPPDMKAQKVRGIDSAVHEFSSNSIKFSSDYGAYSDPLDRGYPKPFTTITINSKPARIVVYDGGADFPFLCNIHFPDTGRPGVTLTLGGGCKDKAALETLQRIYGTVRFK